jgi:RNA polymerase sigma-70 factor (ECF subfamily)
MDERVPGMSSSISAEYPIVSVDVVSSRANNEPVAVEATFETFYFEHRETVARAVALATGDVDQAADSTDEAMIRAYQRWSHVGNLQQPAGWVFRVAVNHSRSRIRRVARKARYAAVLDRDRYDDTPFEQRIGDSEVVNALHELPAAQRSVVVLRILLEFTERECADALGIRPGTAKSRLHRGLAHLRHAVPHLAPELDASAAD